MVSQMVYFSLPSTSFFQLPPSSEPRTLPAPEAGSSLSAPPFSIPPSLYNAALEVQIPITIAFVYAVTAILINKYNAANGNKPWAISKTKAFFYFVVAHNVFLAVYSGWTFVGMLNALRRTFAGWNGPYDLVGAVDSLCKMHGTPGLGNAITYSPEQSQWVSQAPDTVLLSDFGTPSSTDLGRLWNEGLAFYGWIFYLSKFYEVLDTFIILAKGKRSSTLQTYHHAGAMMSMWAGMRFMSPPIWMFVFVNSGIHAMMYTYYTLTAFSVPVPQAIKRSLTTMQITQFLVGASYAALHSFVSYSVPTSSPSPSTPSTPSSTLISSAIPSPTTLTNVLKSLLFRAATAEGLAETIGKSNSPVTTPMATPPGSQFVQVNCLDTSGETFAIWLNVFYLTPLTVLFMRFFIKSYLRRSSGPKSKKAPLEAGERLNGKTNGATMPNGKNH